jgi:hypothetical protein
MSIDVKTLTLSIFKQGKEMNALVLHWYSCYGCVDRALPNPHLVCTPPNRLIAHGLFFLLRLGVRAASNSAYSGYPELWILRYPAHRYRAVNPPGFEPTTLWSRVRRPNHSATALHFGP